ncbi:hypothetical protein [Streptomyces ureilyticus]|uniref:hypothetical protein n=1 Tax=Streptomyces ureilyticus TaxID=1775131 RepID=UPI0019D2340E|nr:hypothetical protein [Streptomyces ureilyticus]
MDPASGEPTVGDETGVIGVGRDRDRQLYVLADWSGSMGANDWGLASCRLALEQTVGTRAVHGLTELADPDQLGPLPTGIDGDCQTSGPVSHSVVTERAAIRGGCGAEAG